MKIQMFLNFKNLKPMFRQNISLLGDWTSNKDSYFIPLWIFENLPNKNREVGRQIRLHEIPHIASLESQNDMELIPPESFKIQTHHIILIEAPLLKNAIKEKPRSFSIWENAIFLTNNSSDLHSSWVWLN